MTKITHIKDATYANKENFENSADLNDKSTCARMCGNRLRQKRDDPHNIFTLLTTTSSLAHELTKRQSSQLQLSFHLFICVGIYPGRVQSCFCLERDYR